MNKKLHMIALTSLIGLVSLFIVAPVSAQDNGQGTEKKSCTGPNGEQYTHGSTYVTYIKVGGKLKTAYTYKCNDGNWEQVSALPVSTINISNPNPSVATQP